MELAILIAAMLVWFGVTFAVLVHEFDEITTNPLTGRKDAR